MSKYSPFAGFVSWDWNYTPKCPNNKPGHDHFLDMADRKGNAICICSKCDEPVKWVETKKDKKDNLGMCDKHPDTKIVFSTWGPMCSKCREENAKKGGRP
jgi:hypothetical protein